MHADEVETDIALVRRLLATQHPQWAELPIARVPSAGTDNAIYRLGDDLAVRLPRIHWAVDLVAKEQRWLPALAPQLPLPVPLPVAAGEPEDAFPYPWGVVQWLPGDMATPDLLNDPIAAARELAAFVRALRAVDPSGGPRHFRGSPVRRADEVLRGHVADLQGEVDPEGLLAAWERVLAAPDYEGPPVWFHGDLSYLNLLVRDGRFAGVIDWGTCGVGDPAIDTIVAWSLFDSGARDAYREALGCDDAAWPRQGLGAAGRRRDPLLPRHQPRARRRQDPRHRSGPRGLTVPVHVHGRVEPDGRRIGAAGGDEHELVRVAGDEPTAGTDVARRHTVESERGRAPAVLGQRRGEEGHGGCQAGPAIRCATERGTHVVGVHVRVEPETEHTGASVISGTGLAPSHAASSSPSKKDAKTRGSRAAPRRAPPARDGAAPPRARRGSDRRAHHSMRRRRGRRRVPRRRAPPIRCTASASAAAASSPSISAAKARTR